MKSYEFWLLAAAGVLAVIVCLVVIAAARKRGRHTPRPASSPMSFGWLVWVLGLLLLAGVAIAVWHWWPFGGGAVDSAVSSPATPAASSSSTWESPDLRQVVRAAQNHWVKVLVMWAILALIALIVSVVWAKYAKAWHGKLQWTMLGVVAFFFAVMPLWYVLEGGPAGKPWCEPTSPTGPGVCIATEEGSYLTADRLTDADEYEFCFFVPNGPGKLVREKVGPNTFKLRSTYGVLPIRHQMFRKGCPTSF